MNLPSLTVENIATALGVFAAGLWVAIRSYLKALKEAPQPRASDVIVSGGTIADMGPFRAIERNTDRMASAMERQAEHIGVIREMLVDRQKDEDENAEIARRAEILAQRMLQQLQPARQARRRKPPA